MTTTLDPVCKVCRRQLSRYTCPKCNLPYCSLTCFRSEAHSQCSETFYRKEIESDIRAEPSKSAQERQRMINLLKRFEDQAEELDVASSNEDDDDDDDDASSLARRLKRVDLEHIPPDALWEMLTPPERDQFLKAIGNPSSELAQQLLSDETLDSTRYEPWWDTPSLPQDEAALAPRRFGSKPKMTMSIPAKMIQPRPDTPFLVYNISAVFLAYAYATRSLGASPLGSLSIDDADRAEARRIISQLTPFLTDRKAKTLYPSLSAAITDVWSRFDPGKATSQVVALLLRDAAHLLRPFTVSLVTQTETAQDEPAVHLSQVFLDSHPSSNALRAMSDLSVVFQRGQNHHHIALKLVFYAAHVLSVPLLALKAVADEMAVRSQKIEGESIEATASAGRQPATIRESNSGLIEEVSFE